MVGGEAEFPCASFRLPGQQHGFFFFVQQILLGGGGKKTRSTFEKPLEYLEFCPVGKQLARAPSLQLIKQNRPTGEAIGTCAVRVRKSRKRLPPERLQLWLRQNHLHRGCRSPSSPPPQSDITTSHYAVTSLCSCPKTLWSPSMPQFSMVVPQFCLTSP